VAWQPIAGAVAGLLRSSGSPRLVVLNPLLDPSSRSGRQRVMLHGLARTDQVLFFSHGGLEAAAALGLRGPRLGFVPLGVRARRAARSTAGTYFLAAGREQRDWATLARAAAGLDADIRVVGPRSLPASAASLTRLPQVDRPRFLELLEGAIALVVPLAATSRPAGQLAVLDALSVGRAVVATRGPGTVDYVAPETGILVPPGDPDALRAALARLLEPGVADALGAGALAAAQGPLSLERFVAAVDAAAHAA
jgi:glycosyltransferase involved in cell wall biosynthesis